SRVRELLPPSSPSGRGRPKGGRGFEAAAISNPLPAPQHFPLSIDKDIPAHKNPRMSFRGGKMAKLVRILAVLVCLAVLTLAVSAQAPKQAAPPKTEKTEQMIDDAHRGILQPKTNPAVEAGKLTNKVMTGAAGKPSAPVSRKNFIDEQIFG